MRPRLKVIVPSYNCPEWIGKCLASIERQTYRNYDVCVVDDGSPDPRHPEIVMEYCRRNTWKAIINPTNESGIASIVKGVAALECDDADVIIEVDGDDWLFSENSLQILADFYAKEDPLMTYGEQVSYRSCLVGPGRHVHRKVARYKRFRKEPFIYSHPRTFRHLLWRQIRDQDLRGPDGTYLKAGWDVPMMFAMLEMAGLRFRYIPAILYVYNDTNPISDRQLRGDFQMRVGESARRLAPYPTLPEALKSI